MENKVSYKISATNNRLLPPTGSGVTWEWGGQGVEEEIIRSTMNRMKLS